jgi:hypothetical protein
MRKRGDGSLIAEEAIAEMISEAAEKLHNSTSSQIVGNAVRFEREHNRGSDDSTIIANALDEIQ